MEANKRYDMFKFLLKVLSGLIIQAKLAQTLCCLYVYLKVKWNVFWQGLSYVALQQFPEKKKKHDLTSVKSKPSEVISYYFRDPKKLYDIMG